MFEPALCGLTPSLNNSVRKIRFCRRQKVSRLRRTIQTARRITSLAWCLVLAFHLSTVAHDLTVCNPSLGLSALIFPPSLLPRGPLRRKRTTLMTRWCCGCRTNHWNKEARKVLEGRRISDDRHLDPTAVTVRLPASAAFLVRQRFRYWLLDANGM